MSNRIDRSRQNSPSLRTTEELARHLGLSRWTISRALNGQPGVSEATRHRIHKLVEDRAFRPSLIAATLRSGRAPLLAVALPGLDHYRLSSKVGRLQETSESLSLRLVVGMTDGDPSHEIETLRHLASLRPSGLIQFASSLPPSHPIWKDNVWDGIPVVQIDPLHSGHLYSVGIDRAAGMSAAIDHLMAQNCSRLIFLGIQKKCAYGAVRLRGIERACRRHGLKSGRDTLFLHLDDRATDSVLDGAALIDLAPPLKPRTGLVALNDAVALGALRRLLELRHTVGHEIKLIGYDDSEFCSSTTPSLSSINPRTPELVQTAAQLLEMAQRHEPTQSRILPRLIARESTLGTQS